MHEGQKEEAADATAIRTVAAIIIPCSSRKRLDPESRARAISLPVGPQEQLETAWLAALAKLERQISAQDLYSGRGAFLGRHAAGIVAAPLFIASAGLGLVAAAEMVPAYGVTAARRGEDSIPARIAGRFDAARWWSAVCAGPMSTTVDRALSGSEGRVTLVALTKPYAAMMADALGALPPGIAATLRIFGWGLHDVLPPALHGAIMGYDARLEAAKPGTRSDFAQRALAHFVESVLPSGRGSAGQHAECVAAMMAGLEAPRRVARPRVTDAEIIAWLGEPAQAGGGIGRLLRRIRDEGIACEQARFSRLHAHARQGLGEGVQRQ